MEVVRVPRYCLVSSPEQEPWHCHPFWKMFMLKPFLKFRLAAWYDVLKDCKNTRYCVDHYRLTHLRSKAVPRTATQLQFLEMKSRRRRLLALLKAYDHANCIDDYSRDLRLAKWGSGIKLHSRNPEPLMSALGQKQTFRNAKAMSALPPKADMVRHDCNVRFWG